MGRKIPAKKHRGVRDPHEQRRQKFLQIKDKINHPPEKQDHQDISNQMKDFIRLKNEAKQGSVKRPKPKEDLPRVAKRPFKELPGFKMRPGEKPRSFLHRVNATTATNMKEAHFEAKYNVDVIKTADGEVKVKKRSEEEMLELNGGKSSSKKNGKKSDDPTEVPKSVKGVQKRKERFDKKKLKKEKKQKLREEKEAERKQMYKTEEIKFGEIAHAPPQLKVIPRRAEKHETVARPGKKNLLLHSMIDKKPENPTKLKSKDIGIKVKTGKLNLKGKRKDLPMRTREALEDEQQSVMQQYREMKKQKMMESKQQVPI